MSKPNTGPLNQQIALSQQQQQAAAQQAALANQYGGQWNQTASDLLGKQNAAIGQYMPGLDALMAKLTGQQGDLMSQLNAILNDKSGPQVMDAKQLAEGLTPEAKAALQSQVLNQDTGFGGAMSKLKASMGARGFGGMGGNADIANSMGSLYAQQQMAKSKALGDITLQNEALANQNIAANRSFNLQNLANAQQYQLGQKQANLQGIGLGSGILGQGNNLYGSQLGALGTLLNAYSPNPYLSASLGAVNAGTGALGAGNQAVSTGMQGAQMLATMPSFWSQLGGSLLGAGTSVLGSWLAPGGLWKGAGSGSAVGGGLPGFDPRNR
jgi:hypothetical protein